MGGGGWVWAAATSHIYRSESRENGLEVRPGCNPHGSPPPTSWGGVMCILLISGTSRDFCVVYFLSLNHPPCSFLERRKAKAISTLRRFVFPIYSWGKLSLSQNKATMVGSPYPPALKLGVGIFLTLRLPSTLLYARAGEKRLALELLLQLPHAE